jgi:hypothetical protein
MMKSVFGAAVWLLMSASEVWSQTTIDLAPQGRNVDFSGAPFTRPVKVGSTLPSTCNVGELFYKVNVPAGANLYGCTSTNIWTAEGSSGASGVSMASQLGDFAVVRTSLTTLSIGGNCSISTPCNVRFGGLGFSFLSGGVVELSAGTGLAFIYVSSSGTLTVGHNLTASCTAGCAAVSGVTSFPADAIPLFQWTAINGQWNVSGGVDQRALLSSKSVTAGHGLFGVETSGKTLLSLDPAISGQRTAVPSTSTSACLPGSWSADASFYYVCVSTNLWRRAALSSF